jgi:CCR4-NOT transcription complex subunit 6
MTPASEPRWHKYVPDAYLNWEYRYSRIREELSQYDADLLCLQEVDVDAYHTQLKPWLHGDGFDSIYISRKSAEVQGPEEGSALFFRQSKLQAVATESVMYSQIWADHSKPRVAKLPGGSSWYPGDCGCGEATVLLPCSML